MSSGYLTPGVPSTEHPHACVHTNEPDTRTAVQEIENNTHDDTGDADEDDACADDAEHDDGRADDALKARNTSDRDTKGRI